MFIACQCTHVHIVLFYVIISSCARISWIHVLIILVSKFLYTIMTLDS